jgi:hypothetical protein
MLPALLACNPADQPIEETLAYRSVWAELYPKSLERDLNPKTLQGAFNFAAAAKSRSEAEQRWTQFLSNWKPENGEYEDAMQANLLRWGELEMQRLESLSHNNPSATEAANNRLRSLAAGFE